jgi:hypothetical protein
MSEEPKKHVIYDDKNHQSLMAEYKTLATFEDATAWDQRAQTEVETIVGAIRIVEAEIVNQSTALEQLKQEHSQKSFLKRSFGTRKDEDEIVQLIEKYRTFQTTLETLASRLQEAIDFTPNSPEEQQAWLKELRLHKKELQVEKRETANAMKVIRDEARIQSVHAGKSFLGLYDSKLASRQRRNIRYYREAALGPQENAKQAIERQILQTEKDILWAERFTE